MPSPTLSDRLLTALKNNRWVAVVIVAATIIGAVASTTNAVEQIREALGLDGRARAVYRPLVADLANVERAMHALGDLNSESHRSKVLILAEVHMLEVAVEPVCNARRSVSELGDTSTRQELDTICTTVEVIKQLAAATDDGLGGPALASVVDSLGSVKKLRQKLLPRM